MCCPPLRLRYVNEIPLPSIRYHISRSFVNQFRRFSLLFIALISDFAVLNIYIIQDTLVTQQFLSFCLRLQSTSEKRYQLLSSKNALFHYSCICIIHYSRSKEESKNPHFCVNCQLFSVYNSRTYNLLYYFQRKRPFLIEYNEQYGFFSLLYCHHILFLV